MRMAKPDTSRMTSGAKPMIMPSMVMPARRPSGVTRNSWSRTAGTLEVRKARAADSRRPRATLL